MTKNLKANSHDDKIETLWKHQIWRYQRINNYVSDMLIK